MPGLKERQRRVVGPMDENHEVKIIIKKSEKYMGNVEVRITKSAFVVYTSTWLFYFIFLKKYLVNLIKKKKKYLVKLLTKRKKIRPKGAGSKTKKKRRQIRRKRRTTSTRGKTCVGFFLNSFSFFIVSVSSS